MDRSSSSESAARRRGGIAKFTIRTLLPLAWLLATADLSAQALRPQEPAARFAGEYGLAVFTDGDSLRVQWVTEKASPGALEVVDAGNGRLLGRVETPAGFAHTASLGVGPPRDLVLRYGEAQDRDARHETRVSLAPPRRPRVAIPAVDSLYVIGDTHGMHEALVRGLRSAGLVDGQLRWTGGRKHVVLAGDLLDRGPDVHRNLWLIYRLESEAAAAGGAVHTLLGNHEILVMLDDLRYVHPKELEIADLHGIAYRDLFDSRRSVLGRWLASKPALLRVGRVLIVHGGVDEAFVGTSLEQIDAVLARYIGEIPLQTAATAAGMPTDSVRSLRHEAFFWADNSLFWHRDYVRSDTLQKQLERVLRHFRSDVLVVGHSDVPTPEARYGGRLIAAHTPRYGADVVLLVRSRRTLQRYWIGEKGVIPF